MPLTLPRILHGFFIPLKTKWVIYPVIGTFEGILCQTKTPVFQHNLARISFGGRGLQSRFFSDVNPRVPAADDKFCIAFAWKPKQVKTTYDCYNLKLTEHLKIHPKRHWKKVHYNRNSTNLYGDSKLRLHEDVFGRSCIITSNICIYSWDEKLG